jgi:DUF4097 and DUF4098 domain-containing protein YvlB
MAARCGLVLTALVIASAGSAQDETLRVQCGDNGWGWGGPRGRACETRDLTVPASGRLSVDAGANGSIRVTGEDRRDVQVHAVVHAWGSSEAEAERIAGEVVVRSGGSIRAEGPEQAGRSGWSVSYDVRVPREVDLSLKTHNGGISVTDVRGELALQATNGGMSLDGVAGDVRGRTTNGGVAATLTGNRWDGAGLDLETTNGGVRLRVPERYSARLETRTVNGGIDLDFPVTVTGRIGREISTTLGNGGALVRAATTNGQVRVSRLDASLPRVR